jgi:hypothetical protein
MILTEKASYLGFPAMWLSIQAIRPYEHCSFQYTDTALVRAFVYILNISPRSAYYFVAKMGQDITPTWCHIPGDSNTPN